MLITVLQCYVIRRNKLDTYYVTCKLSNKIVKKRNG